MSAGLDVSIEGEKLEGGFILSLSLAKIKICQRKVHKQQGENTSQDLTKAGTPGMSCCWELEHITNVSRRMKKI